MKLSQVVKVLKEPQRLRYVLDPYQRPAIFHRPFIFRAVVARFESIDRKWRSRGSSQGIEMGDCFEFGVWNGTSMLQFWDALRRVYGKSLPSNWHMHGFDSFEGMPELKDEGDKHPFIGRGAFRSEDQDEVVRRLEERECASSRFSL